MARKKQLSSVKLKFSSIIDIILNIVILGVLIAIIIMLVKCHNKNKEFFSGLDPEKKYACSGEKEDPSWVNNTMCQDSKFLMPHSNNSRLIATNPIHNCGNNF
tara:strand:+ start:1072 stop:1380 length:309 start_codon:yes stop_codon:yes gene_type:complete